MSNLITLDDASPSVQYLCQKDKRLAKVISMVGPISYIPHDENAYPFLIHEIIEQMLSIKAGQKIYGRLEELCHGDITPEQITFLSDEQIRGTGTSNAKVSYIRNMTNAIMDGSICLEQLRNLSDEDVIKALTKIRGIGKWTAKMYLIFVLDRPDVLPVEDGAFLQAYRWMYKTDDCSEKTVYKKCKKWKPYSSTASRFLYRALDTGLTRQEFHIFK
ncbi:MAG: DNA-3-methyladenine glycosylase 2 family protein [Clostridiales bacterium]|nr:DNA-3-methyladenine glycosylase 2 family protein [Clostridiales bacterium]